MIYNVQKQPPEVYEKVFLEISLNSQKNNCARFSFLIKLQVSGEICEFSEISKNTFFTEYLWTTASECHPKLPKTVQRKIYNWNKADIGQLRVDAISQTNMFIQVDTVKKQMNRRF